MEVSLGLVLSHYNEQSPKDVAHYTGCGTIDASCKIERLWEKLYTSQARKEFGPRRKESYTAFSNAV